MRRWLMAGVLVAVAGCATGERAGAPASGAPASEAPASRASEPRAPESEAPESRAPESGGPIDSAGSPSPVVTGAGCNGTPVFLGDGFPEVRGTARDAELWGLLFTPPPPLPRGEEIKIVWRMTGEGPPQIRATLPDGTAAKLVWGPEEHGGSSWRRPGQEWGTGFVFPKRGCWKIELSRTRGSGHVWLPVR